VTNNNVKKLYVDDDGMVTFLCPKCGDSRKHAVERYRDVTGLVKMGCICGHTSEVKLEFRKHFRKETALEGLYFREVPHEHWAKMIVRNLSIVGCRFEMIKKAPLTVGEDIRVQFTLDNQRHSIIKKKAIVSEVEGASVGCKFMEPPGYIDSELGFYLRIPGSK